MDRKSHRMLIVGVSLLVLRTAVNTHPDQGEEWTEAERSMCVVVCEHSTPSTPGCP